MAVKKSGSHGGIRAVINQGDERVALAPTAAMMSLLLIRQPFRIGTEVSRHRGDHYGILHL